MRNLSVNKTHWIVKNLAVELHPDVDRTRMQNNKLSMRSREVNRHSKATAILCVVDRHISSKTFALNAE
jgi:hypothetical protein